MFRIVFLLALISTNALAEDWQDIMSNDMRAKAAEDQAERFHSDEMFMRQREMDARADEAYMADRRQSMIQGQLNQLNMNTVPLR